MADEGRPGGTGAGQDNGFGHGRVLLGRRGNARGHPKNRPPQRRPRDAMKRPAALSAGQPQGCGDDRGAFHRAFLVWKDRGVSGKCD